MKPYEAYEGDVIEDLIQGQEDAEFLQIATGRSPTTRNKTLCDLWNEINRYAQTISVSKGAGIETYDRSLYQAALDGMMRIFESLSYKVVTRAASQFVSIYSEPPQHSYEHVPIKWPGVNDDARSIIIAFCEAGHAVTRVPSQVVEKGIPDSHAQLIAMPLYAAKAEIMRNIFQVEVKGEVTPDELTALFRDKKVVPQLSKSIDDSSDTASDKAAKDAEAKSNESSYQPTATELAEVKQGEEIVTWMPTEGAWLTASEIQRRSAQPIGPIQTAPQPFPLSADVVGANSQA